VTLSIPYLDPDVDILTAALAYAKCGFYVLPVHPETKRPDLPKGWPTMTSNDTEQIVAWFAGSNSQLGLHVGRSGAVVLDVDEPDLLPPALEKATRIEGVPFQSTREANPRRGHYVFRMPEGRRLGNSRGRFSDTRWGEVRGMNGIIVVQPSAHSKGGGRYQWITTGDVPALPEEIDSGLPDMQDAESVASDEQVRLFLDSCTSAARPSLLTAVGQSFARGLKNGSRHEALVDALAWGMREAASGLYPARSVVDMLLPDFEQALRAETGRNAVAEFRGVLAWAVAQAQAIDPAQRAAEVAERIAASTRVGRDDLPIASGVDATAGAVPPPAVAGGTPATTPTLVRQAANVQLIARQVPTTPQPRPASDYIDKSEGLRTDLLAGDVMNMGELAFGGNNQFWSYENGVWKSSKDVVAARCVWLLRGQLRNSHISNVKTYVQHSVSEITCEPTPEYINFTNGMLDWRSGEMLDHAPHFGSTVQLPVEYDPQASCPVFNQFLDQILSPDFKKFAWEMIGYMMMSGNPLQSAFMLLGTGSNGKGTLMRVIGNLLGRENCSAISLDSLTTNRFAPAGLFGKLANIAGDIDATYQENTAIFKTLTGEDDFSGEYKGQDQFMFKSWAVPIFSANKVPGSADTTKGYLRRWKILEFNATIEDKDAIPGLSDKLTAELPGIAAEGIRHLREVMGRNDGRGGFHTSTDIEQGKERFAENLDQVRQWLADATIPMEGNQEKLSDAYKAYRFWATEQGNRPVKSSEFESRLKSMEELGHKVGKSNGQRFVRHIGIVAYGEQITTRPATEADPV
jgi:putative DNA primase/helicase